MQFFKLASVLATATMVSAINTVMFVSVDDVDRTVYWTGSPGMPSIEETTVPGGQNVTVEVPESWIGNFYAVCDGSENTPGMLGEVSFQSWNNLNFYDVSAIVSPNDDKGVALMYPADEPWTPTSGCAVSFPCNNAYYLPDDIQTKSTTSTAIITQLGLQTSSTRDLHEEREDNSENFPRDAVTVPMWRPKRA